MSKIAIKTPAQVEKIRQAGLLSVRLLDFLTPLVKPGVTTVELDRAASQYITQELGAISATLGYHGFPKSICTSINEVVCHGIPSSKTHLRDGDILNIDVTLIKDGFYADTSIMYQVGSVSKNAKRLVARSRRSI